MRTAFAHRDFRLLQAARFATIVASQAQNVAIGWQVYHLTGRTLDLGLVGLVQFVPFALFALFAGHTADRVERRRILVATHAAKIVCSLALFAIASADVRSPLPIYAVLALVGVERAFSGAAGQSLLPQVVPPESFANAVAWSSSVWQGAMIVGPAVGGVAYGALGGPLVYLGAAIAAALATVCTLVMDVRPRETTAGPGAPSADALLAGVRYVFRNKPILGAISLDLFAVLFGGAVALLPVFARDVLDTGPWGLGLLRSAQGVGAMATAIFLAYRPLRRNVGVVMLVSVALFGIATIAFGCSRSFPLSFAALVVAGAADMVSAVIRHTLVQLWTPDEMRGRVSAVNLVFIGASNELGEFESGAVAALIGAVPTVIVGGLGTVVVVLLWSVLFGELRRVRTLEEGAA